MVETIRLGQGRGITTTELGEMEAKLAVRGGEGSHYECTNAPWPLQGQGDP